MISEVSSQGQLTPLLWPTGKAEYGKRIMGSREVAHFMANRRLRGMSK